ncbi:MAG: hypothetical protein AB7O39_03300 [Flavobacteriaceae bacterium]
MAWAKAQIELAPSNTGTGLKVSLKRTNKSSARLSMTISEAVAKNLDWADGNKIEVMIGEGEHHGLIRLRKNNSAGQAEVQRRETGKGAWFSLRLGHQPAFVDRSEAPRWCQWEAIEDGWVEIVLPSWADETGPRRDHGKAGAAMVGVTARNGGAPARPAGADVTGALMGDPPPGRSALAQKAAK